MDTNVTLLTWIYDMHVIKVRAVLSLRHHTTKYVNFVVHYRR